MAIDVNGLSPLLQVYDMARALGFYRDVLGFELAASSPPDDEGHFDWCMLELGGAVLMLNTAYERHDRPAAEPERREDRGVTLYLGCTSVDEVYAHMRDKGWNVKPPTSAPYGMRQLYVRDPDGFELCFQHPVA